MHESVSISFLGSRIFALKLNQVETDAVRVFGRWTPRRWKVGLVETSLHPRQIWSCLRKLSNSYCGDLPQIELRVPPGETFFNPVERLEGWVILIFMMCWWLSEQKSHRRINCTRTELVFYSFFKDRNQSETHKYNGFGSIARRRRRKISGKKCILPFIENNPLLKSPAPTRR